MRVSRGRERSTIYFERLDSSEKSMEKSVSEPRKISLDNSVCFNILFIQQYFKLYKNIKLSSGIQLAYIFNTTESLSSTSTIKGFSSDITNSINKINCALPLDVNYLLQKFPISINVRYNYGLNNLYTSGEKINVLQFGINYKLVSSFTLKK